MADRKLYKAYMTSDAWRIKRYAYFTKFGKTCKACGTLRDIIVHHMTYERFTKENLSDLVSLCKTCHEEVHKRHRANRKLDLMLVTKSYIKQKRNGI